MQNPAYALSENSIKILEHFNSNLRSTGPKANSATLFVELYAAPFLNSYKREILKRVVKKLKNAELTKKISEMETIRNKGKAPISVAPIAPVASAAPIVFDDDLLDEGGILSFSPLTNTSSSFFQDPPASLSIEPKSGLTIYGNEKGEVAYVAIAPEVSAADNQWLKNYYGSTKEETDAEIEKINEEQRQQFIL